ncbi:hypothetical protein SeMB42_g04043 [Synchytrium endobioticum]|uniref:E3 ubiquitin protein ligase n=1 Tax=Synchytrium endobioticum TaxID=286115 RepID=A0A507DHV3_9FUNG|nr:hypothetical protein SeMB42_g04043 [Synchytrium endobioticum]TPX50981.1 hypothetical protein SeLEV6574_g00600 [Synchytrium endobioticum]
MNNHRKRWPSEGQDQNAKRTKVDKRDPSLSGPEAADASHKDDLRAPVSIENQDAVVMFQKQAIWRQMQEYKRSLDRAHKQILDLDARTDMYRTNLVAVYTYWEQIHNDITEQVTLLKSSSSGKDPPDTANGVNEFTKRLLNPLCAKDEIEGALRSKMTLIRNMLDQLARCSLSSNNDSISDKQYHLLQKKYQQISNQVAKLEAQIQVHKLRETDLEDRLDETRLLLLSAERKIDRLKMNGLYAESNNPSTVAGRKNAPSLVTVPSSSSAPVVPSGPPSAVPSETNLDTVNPTNSVIPDNKDEFQQDLVIAQMLAEARLKELDDMKRERLTLRERIDALLLQQKPSPVGLEIITTHPEFQKVLNDARYFNGEAQMYRERNEKLVKEAEELQTERRTFQKQVEEEWFRQKERLEAEVKRVEHDLQRVRQHRDTLDDSLNLRLAKDIADVDASTEVKKIANAQKNTIAALMDEVKRLKMCLAANAGDKALLHYFGVEDVDGKGNPIDDLRTQLSTAKSQLQACLQATSPEILDRQKMLAREKQLIAEVEQARQKLAEYESAYGLHNLDSSSCPMNELTRQLKQHHEKIKEYELKIDFYSRTETQLLAEVDNLFKAYRQLEEQNTNKVLQLNGKEEQILRLVAERTTLKQQLDKARKEMGNTQNLVMALRRQSEKQLEMIKKAEEKEKVHIQQVSTSERVAASATATAEAHRKEAIRLKHQCDELNDKCEKMGQRFEELTAAMKKRTEEWEDERDAVRRAQEQAEVYKKRLELRETERPIAAPASDSSMQRQLDEYRGLLLCRTCNVRFKDTVISKCWHVFCKECVDDVVNARSRKCPTCGNMFGKEDVKSIYL